MHGRACRKRPLRGRRRARGAIDQVDPDQPDHIADQRDRKQQHVDDVEDRGCPAPARRDSHGKIILWRATDDRGGSRRARAGRGRRLRAAAPGLDDRLTAPATAPSVSGGAARERRRVPGRRTAPRPHHVGSSPSVGSRAGAPQGETPRMARGLPPDLPGGVLFGPGPGGTISVGGRPARAIARGPRRPLPRPRPTQLSRARGRLLVPLRASRTAACVPGGAARGRGDEATRRRPADRGRLCCASPC